MASRPIWKLSSGAAPYSATEAPPDYPPAAIGLLPGDGDEYLLLEGGPKGQHGFFTRIESGAVVGVDLAGGIATRVSAKES
jgi:hypothetical protein